MEFVPVDQELEVGSEAESQFQDPKRTLLMQMGMLQYSRAQKHPFCLRACRVSRLERLPNARVVHGKAAVAGFSEFIFHESVEFYGWGFALVKSQGRIQIMRILCFFLLFVSQAWGSDLPWKLVQGSPWIDVTALADAFPLKSWHQRDEGKLLLEHKVSKRTAMMLEGAPYLIANGVFLAIPEPLTRRQDRLLLSAGAIRQLGRHLFSQKEVDALESSLEKVVGEIDGGVCMLQRPVHRVMLDPGHGGDDHGAKREGVKEKDVVLRFASILAEELRRRGFLVSLTRTKDVFLPLDVRSRLALDWKADLFLSLHVNSAPDSEVEGTETYILSADATDAAARKLALIENAIPEEAKKQGSAVQEILWDIQQVAYLQDSAYLASYIQEQVETTAKRLHASGVIRAKWKNRGVRQAPFFVLNRASMPAALVELGYVTNSRDRQLLQQRFFLESLARAVADGVNRYKESCKKRR